MRGNPADEYRAAVEAYGELSKEAEDALKRWRLRMAEEDLAAATAVVESLRKEA